VPDFDAAVAVARCERVDALEELLTANAAINAALTTAAIAAGTRTFIWLLSSIADRQLSVGCLTHDAASVPAVPPVAKTIVNLL
jgi:hypothetical protein